MPGHLCGTTMLHLYGVLWRIQPLSQNCRSLGVDVALCHVMIMMLFGVGGAYYVPCRHYKASVLQKIVLTSVSDHKVTVKGPKQTPAHFHQSIL